MIAFLEQYFFIIFIIGWVVVSMSLVRSSGWAKLVEIYPDSLRTEVEPLRVYRFQSARMGNNTSFRGTLTFEVYISGLRLKNTLLGGFIFKAVFIPWSEITVEHKKIFFAKMVALSFKKTLFPVIDIDEKLSKRIWKTNHVIDDDKKSAIVESLKFWLISTALAFLFFNIAPRVFEWTSSKTFSGENLPPLNITIIFPAVVLGIVTIIRHFINRD